MKKQSNESPALSDNRKQFVKHLNNFAAYGYSKYTVWSDFLHIAAISLANNCDPYHTVTSQKIFEEREETYKHIIGKYKPQAQELFADMYATLVKELSTYPPGSFTDVLGELFMELEFGDEWKGQFFTPQYVSDLCGRITVDEPELKRKGYVTLNEPCQGGGSMILGVANAISNLGYNPQKTLLTIANDLDERSVHMCFIQLSLYGLPAIVLRQNTLTLETFGDAWVTPMFIFDAWTFKARRFFRQSPAEEPKVEPPIAEPAFEQLSLF